MSNNIKNIEDFVKKINSIRTDDNKTIFYRGHSDENYKLEPSVYRGNYIENEHKIYRDIISKVPNEFEDKKTIEALALMQHYGVPTRILDLTTNALVALYFACLDNDKNGEVLVFGIPKESVCYSDSDRVTVLANLAKCEKDFYYKKELLPVYEEYLSIIDDIIEEKEKQLHGLPNVALDNFFDYLKQKEEYIVESLFSNENNEIKLNFSNSEEVKSEIRKERKNSINSIINNVVFDYKESKLDESSKEKLEDDILRRIKGIVIVTINKVSIPNLNERYFGKLLHNIREDKSYFQSIINPNDVGSVFAVLPKLDNPRIIRQQGAFLIFGVKESPMFSIPVTPQKIKEMAEVDESWILQGKKELSDRIIIDKDSKETIKQELEKLGVSNWTLFPEIDKVADDIRKKYQ